MNVRSEEKKRLVTPTELMLMLGLPSWEPACKAAGVV